MSGSERLREMIGDGRIHLMDGAVGTELYKRGVFVNVCYDELNLTEPDLVLSVHADYIRAGSELIETNTFGANPVKLSSFGLEDRTEEINETAAGLAVRAANGRALVLGSIGPLGIRIEPWGPTSTDEATDFFARQAAGLAEGGVAGFILETFADLAELEAALAAVRRVAHDLPAFAQMSFGEEGTSAYGTTVEQMVRTLVETDADVLGLNCSVGPSATLDAAERLVAVADRPVSALPNAGLPRTVADRKIYMASPEYVARYARRMADAGVRFLGGCCGTTAEHIRHMAGHLETVGVLDRIGAGSARGADSDHAGDPDRATPGSPGSRVAGVSGAATGDEIDPDSLPSDHTTRSAPVALGERSELGRRLAAGEFVRGVELLPPRGWDASGLATAARRARETGFTTVHLLDSSARHSRMASLAAAIVVEREAGIETVPHYTCRDRNMLGMVGDLLGAASAGLRNLLVITGDPPRSGPYDMGGVYDIDSIGLTNVVHELNAGRDPGGEPIGRPTRFVTGVGLNPSAVDPETEIRRFMWKADAGADFAVTQPIYDPDAFCRFLERIERYEVPILAGLLPPLSLRNAEYLANEVPGLAVPRRVLDRMHRAAERGPKAEADEGVAIAAEVYAAICDRVAGVVVSCPQNRVERAERVLGG